MNPNFFVFFDQLEEHLEIWFACEFVKRLGKKFWGNSGFVVTDLVVGYGKQETRTIS